MKNTELRWVAYYGFVAGAILLLIGQPALAGAFFAAAAFALWRETRWFVGAGAAAIALTVWTLVGLLLHLPGGVQTVWNVLTALLLAACGGCLCLGFASQLRRMGESSAMAYLLAALWCAGELAGPVLTALGYIGRETVTTVAATLANAAIILTIPLALRVQHVFLEEGGRQT